MSRVDHSAAERAVAAVEKRPSTQLVDLVQQLRGHLMELRSPKTKQTAGVVWDIERHERWLSVLEAESVEPSAGEAAAQILAKATVDDPVDQLLMARVLVTAASAQLHPVRKSIATTIITAIAAIVDGIDADAKLDQAVAKANTKGGGR